jgi:hypothetical protein
MPFRQSSHFIPDVLGALLLIRRRIRENPAMTQRMYDAISEILEQIYFLPVIESESSTDFIVPNDGIYERMDNRLRRMERWVCQWPDRSMIDNAFDHFRLTYREFIMRAGNLQDEERRNAAQDYVDEFEEFGSDSEPETIGIDDSDDSDDSVVTPPPPQPSRPEAERRNRD